MNVHSPVRRRRPLKLGTDDFQLLRASGAFENIWRPELLDGKLFGTPRPAEGGEPESDAYVRFKLTVDLYHRLDESGSFEQYPGTELIDGEVFPMSPQHRQHGFVKDEIAYRLRRCLERIGSPLSVATEQSVWISPTSEPQLDVILTTERRGLGPIPVGTVALLCEISTTTLNYDLGDKADIYAAAEVPEYWVADVNDRLFHRMWSPVSGGYSRKDEVAFGNPLVAATQPAIEIGTEGF